MRRRRPVAPRAARAPGRARRATPRRRGRQGLPPAMSRRAVRPPRPLQGEVTHDAWAHSTGRRLPSGAMAFHHVALATRDLEATHAFYTDVMSFTLVKA